MEHCFADARGLQHSAIATCLTTNRCRNLAWKAGFQPAIQNEAFLTEANPTTADRKTPAPAGRSVLVVGAGVAGIKASLDLAEAGVHVYLLDIRHHAGGTLAQLEKQFPTNHCGMCRALPSLGGRPTQGFCLRREIYHENVTLLPGTALTGLSGEAGNFEAVLETRPSGVDAALCIACRRCLDVCPVEVPDEFNEGLSTRKAIYIRYPLAVPNIYAVDFDACTRCGKCVEACPTNAVNLEVKPEKKTLAVGAAILTAGFEEFTASSLGQYGHGRWKNVVTGIEFERLLSEVNPEGGALRRPSDGKKPRRIAFLQCVGSRDTERPYCSGACCMFALKESLMALEADDDVEVHVFAMDVRAFGKGYHRYLEGAKRRGVRIRRGRIPALRETPGTGNLELTVADEEGRPRPEVFDMAVLSVGFRPPPGAKDLMTAAGLEPGPHGFCPTAPLAPVDTEREGVFVAGPLSEPKDIPETIAQASATAARVLALVAPEPEPAPAEGDAQAEDAEGAGKPAEEREARAAVVLCACAGEIGDALDLEALGEAMKAHPSVAHVEISRVLCAAQAPEEAARRAVEAGADRILFGACVPYRFAALFRKAAVEAGLGPEMVETVNLKEGVVWVHEGTEAFEKAKVLLRMALGRLLLQRPETTQSFSVRREVLVAGGGPAGLTAAVALAESGFPVHLVEKTDSLGGHLREPPPTFERGDAKAFVEDLIAKAEAAPNVTIHLQSEWASLAGSAGNFQSRIRGPAGNEEIRHGAGIVAVGGTRVDPGAYLCGEHPRSMTQLDFARRIASGEIDPASVETVAAILCAGLRSDPRPWCGRACCVETLAALETVLDANPKAKVYVFHRDVMTYGFFEEDYLRLREKGALFIRIDPLGEEGPPSRPGVRAEGEGLSVEGYDPAAGASLRIRPDYLVVSSGWGPPETFVLADTLGVELDEDGFFHETDVKWRPVDFVKDGLFLAGHAHSPRTTREAVWTALAAAGRVLSLLSKGSVTQRVPVVSEVDARRCSGCGACVEACPFEARFLDETSGVAVVREALCQGCGACQTACPNDAAKILGFKHRQVSAMIDAALEIGT